jgi:hypothetical protein
MDWRSLDQRRIKRSRDSPGIRPASRLFQVLEQRLHRDVRPAKQPGATYSLRRAFDRCARSPLEHEENLVVTIVRSTQRFRARCTQATLFRQRHI